MTAAFDALPTPPPDTRLSIAVTAASVTLALSLVALHAVAYAAVTAGLHASPMRIDALGPADEARVDMLEGALRAAPFASSVTRVRRGEVLADASGGSADIARLVAAYPVANPFPDALLVTLRTATAYDDLFALLEDGTYDDVLGDAMPAIRAQARNALIVVGTLRTASAVVFWLMVLALASATAQVHALVQAAEHSAMRRVTLQAVGAGIAGFALLLMAAAVAAHGIPLVGAALTGLLWQVPLALCVVATPLARRLRAAMTVRA